MGSADRYPVDFREREGAAILKEIGTLEATLSHDMLLWNYAQRVEASRLRAADPIGDPATETRRLREQQEAVILAQRYPSTAQGRNILLPEAWRLINAGNLERAQVYVEAARQVGAQDGRVEHALNRLLDATVPHRKKAVGIEIAAADELELSRRDIAEMKVIHSIGTAQEQNRASTALKMADYKRQLEAPILAKELGIELPAATD